MKMKEVSKGAVALAAATIIGIGTMAGAPVSAKAAETDWVLQLRNGASREAVYNGFIGSAEFANLCQNAGITVGGAIADNGTTGRQSTGEKVNVYLEEYVNGEYGRTSYIGQPTEGQLIDLSGSYEAFAGAGSNVRTETEPFIAYEGSTGKINYVGDLTLDFLN